MGSRKKTGGISKEDRQFIIDNMNILSVEDIAEKVGRHVYLIEKIIKNYAQLPQADNQSARWHLRRSIYWKHLKEEFSDQELNMIEDMYVKYVQQFNEDVYASEEVQILNLIKLQIMMDRNLKGKQKIVDNMRNYERQAQNFLDRVNDDISALTEDERNVVMDLQDKAQACLSAESQRTIEYVNLQKEHNTLLEKVMGSRDQRVKQILNQKISFFGLVKELLDRDKADKESRFLQLYCKAADKEFDRLSAPHKYEDGSIDNPILTAEVVEKYDELEKKGKEKTLTEEEIGVFEDE